MSLIFAIFLGLVQGVTEFLPVSSSGHLAIFQNVFGLENVEKSHLFFDVLLHFGTLIAVCVVYWKEIRGMLGAITGLFGGRRTETGSGNTGSLRLFLLIFVSTIPLVFAVFLKKYIEFLYTNTAFIGFALIITGGLLLIGDKIVTGKKTETNARVSDAVAVGLIQTLALLPGLSRSGSTITAGLFRGFDRRFAVKYSFLLSIPAIIGANILSLIDALGSGIDWSLMPVYLAGVIVAAISGFYAIKLVKMLSDKGKFGKFAYYCWGAGILAIILSITVSL